MIKISKEIARQHKAKRPQTLMKMPAIWWGEHCAEKLFLGWPAASEAGIHANMEERERLYLEAHPEASPTHLKEAGTWFREGYRKQWEKLIAGADE